MNEHVKTIPYLYLYWSLYLDQDGVGTLNWDGNLRGYGACFYKARGKISPKLVPAASAISYWPSPARLLSAQGCHVAFCGLISSVSSSLRVAI